MEIPALLGFQAYVSILEATVFRSYQQDKENALLQYSLLKEGPVVLMLIDCPCKS